MSNSEEKDVLFEKNGSVGWLSINRDKKRNTINMRVATQVPAILDKYRDDRSIKAIMLTAAGNIAFCAGNDLAEFKARLPDPARMREFDDAVLRMHESIRTFPKIVIAVVNGYCLGGGVTLLGACDLALASEAAEFGLPEVARGFWPAMATTPVMHALHRKHALSLILTAKNITAREAMMMGLVSKVVPSAELAESAEQLAQTIAGYELEALLWAKRIAYDSLRMDYGQSMQYGVLAAQAFRDINPSFGKGIQSFLKKST